MALVGGDQQRHEGAHAVVHAAPADVERALPHGAVVGDDGAAAADAGVVEQQVDVIGLVLGDDGIAEGEHRRLVGHVAHVRRDDGAGRGDLEREALRLVHLLDRHVAHRDVAALRGELENELAAHPTRTAGDDRDLALEALHRSMLAQRPRRLLHWDGGVHR